MIFYTEMNEVVIVFSMESANHFCERFSNGWKVPCKLAKHFPMVGKSQTFLREVFQRLESSLQIGVAFSNGWKISSQIGGGIFIRQW